VEGQRTGERTDSGGACSGDEEDGSEKLGDEHGDVGDVFERNPSPVLCLSASTGSLISGSFPFAGFPKYERGPLFSLVFH
jgi:hypothetical protein